MGKSGNTCAVAICPSPQDASYHHFPKDLKLKKIWTDRCNRKDNINPQTAKICSEHFKQEDFIRDLQAELLGQPRRRRLHPEYIPSRNLKPLLGDADQNEERQNDAGKVAVK